MYRLLYEKLCCRRRRRRRCCRCRCGATTTTNIKEGIIGQGATEDRRDVVFLFYTSHNTREAVAVGARSLGHDAIREGSAVQNESASQHLPVLACGVCGHGDGAFSVTCLQYDVVTYGHTVYGKCRRCDTRVATVPTPLRFFHATQELSRVKVE